MNPVDCDLNGPSVDGSYGVAHPTSRTSYRPKVDIVVIVFEPHFATYMSAVLGVWSLLSWRIT